LALTSPTSGGPSVGIVLLRTKGHGVLFNINKFYARHKNHWKTCHDMQMVATTSLVFGTLIATKTARYVELRFVASRAPDGILQTSASLKHVPFYLTQKKFVSFSLRSHNSLTYTTQTHKLTHFFSSLFLPFCSTPPSLVISLLAPSTPFRKSWRVTLQIEACALLTAFLAIHSRLAPILRAMLTLSYKILCSI
jgi:hypothetical protein